MSLTLLNLLPSELNTYGDAGNLLTIRKRCEWRGIAVEQIDFEAGSDPAMLENVDLILGGGGQESSLAQAQAEILRLAPYLHQLIEQEVPALTICVSFQLLGEYLETAAGEHLEGAGIFSLHTVSETERKIGNIVISNSDFGEILGYENHLGRTYLHEGQEPLAQVVSGFGNNGTDGTEGARYKQAFGTYLHGPLLPKNPRLADYLIATALKRHYGQPIELALLPDPWIEQARTVIKSRPQ